MSVCKSERKKKKKKKENGETTGSYDHHGPFRNRTNRFEKKKNETARGGCRNKLTFEAVTKNGRRKIKLSILT